MRTISLDQILVSGLAVQLIVGDSNIVLLTDTFSEPWALFEVVG